MIVEQPMKFSHYLLVSVMAKEPAKGVTNKNTGNNHLKAYVYMYYR